MCFDECLVDCLAVTDFCCEVPSLVNMSLSDVVGKPGFPGSHCDTVYDEYRYHYWNNLTSYIHDKKTNREKPYPVFYL